LRLQTHVAKGNIKKDEVKVHYVYSSAYGDKKAKELNLNDRGFFEEKWPEGFFPERFEEARNLALAASKNKH
jgi:predicted ATPase